MGALNQVDKQLFTTIVEAGGWTEKSLWQICLELGIGYNNARDRAHRLKRLGAICLELVSVKGRQGKSLRLCCRCMISADRSCRLARSDDVDVVG